MMSEESSCSASIWNFKISYMDFTYDAVIFTEMLDILMGAIESLKEDWEPLELQVSWVKINIQAFNDLLDAAVSSVPVCGEEVEVRERFTYVGSDIPFSACCDQEVNRRVVVLSVPLQEEKI